MSDIPTKLLHPDNARVLSFLHNQSAHSDTAEVFAKAISPLPKVATYCPDGRNFSYVLAHTNTRIFGFVTGMLSMTFKLPEIARNEAFQNGGTQIVRLPDLWVDFPVYQSTAIIPQED